MSDVNVKLSIITRGPHREYKTEKAQLEQICWLLNTLCTHVEDLHCDVFYKMEVNGEEYHQEMP